MSSPHHTPRVNAMNHVAYNTWTLREKVAMPEVRFAIAKFVFCAIALSLLLAFYTAIWVCILQAIPIFYAEHNALLHQAWLLKIGCRQAAPPEGLVIVRCAQAESTVGPSVIWTTAVPRTLEQLTAASPIAHMLLTQWLDCQDESSLCHSGALYTIERAAQDPIFFFGLYWLSATLSLLASLLSCGPVPRSFRALRGHLQAPSEHAVKYACMSTREQEAYLGALASPTATSYTSGMQPNFPNHVHAAWNAEDEQAAQDVYREHEEGKDQVLRHREGAKQHALHASY